MNEDELTRLRAQMDQAREGMREIAGSCWAFYSALVDEGFTPGQALDVLQTWLAATVDSLRGGDG